MELTDIWIIVGKLVKPALGHIRGDLVMVPSDHGPLYFYSPQWHTSKESAEECVASRLKRRGEKITLQKRSGLEPTTL